jgi:hypothetical protein
MTFEELLALDDDALNRLIEQVCYPEHHWQPGTLTDRDCWELVSPDVPGRLWSTVPHLHYTASWDRVMALAWRFRIGLWPLPPGTDEWIVQYPATCTTLAAETEAALRRRICQLAAWQALQQRIKENVHV